MTKAEMVCVTCDRCRWTYAHPGKAEDVLTVLRASGWKLSRSWDLCPLCAEEARREKE